MQDEVMDVAGDVPGVCLLPRRSRPGSAARTRLGSAGPIHRG